MFGSSYKDVTSLGNFAAERQILSGDSNGSRARERIASKLKPAFAALLEAFDYAEDTGSDLWLFAVAMRRLKKLSLSESDLRWLELKGYVRHALEVTRLEDDSRDFLHTGNLAFSKRTCFVLTAGAPCLGCRAARVARRW
ncbi:MAG: hypothetical protein HYV60_23415 [Planctomycetia bacterium]|nr:hypothetical protein [Planctomycetia bacterium]